VKWLKTVQVALLRLCDDGARIGTCYGDRYRVGGPPVDLT
jgi:hypothetical protein